MAKRLGNKQSQKRVDLTNDYKIVFGSEEGKSVLHDMMKSSLMFETTFDSNPQIAAFNEGRRSFVTQLLAILKIDTNELYKRMKEQEEIEKQYSS